MKKLIIIIAILIMAGVANAQTWYTANQVTLAWDPVPKVLATDQANRYQVYSRNDLVSNGTKIGAEVTATQLLVSFAAEGRYYLGVKSVRYPAGETVGIQSVGTAWSNVAADTNNSPFGVSYFIAPIFPGGLKLVP